jgi:heme exporter protein CcmD
MDPRYAFFIWASFGLVAVVVLWNLVAPTLARNQIQARWSEAQDDDPNPPEEP